MIELMRVWLSNNRNVAHSFGIAQKPKEHPSSMEFCDSHTQSLRPGRFRWTEKDADREHRCSVQKGAARGPSAPGRETCARHDGSCQDACKNRFVFLGIFSTFITIWFALQWRGGRKHSFLCEDRFSSLCWYIVFSNYFYLCFRYIHCLHTNQRSSNTFCVKCVNSAWRGSSASFASPVSCAALGLLPAASTEIHIPVGFTFYYYLLLLLANFYPFSKLKYFDGHLLFGSITFGAKWNDGHLKLYFTWFCASLFSNVSFFVCLFIFLFDFINLFAGFGLKFSSFGGLSDGLHELIPSLHTLGLPGPFKQSFISVS